jgi:hypothetical protein
MSVSATVSVNSDPSLSLSTSTTSLVTASGTSISLLPGSKSENQFVLTFQAGTDVRSVTGISNISVSNSSVSVTAGTGATATCTYNSVPTSAVTATFTLNYTPTSNVKVRSEDPTITFNPPSGVGEIEIEQVPVAAEEVLV